MDSRQRQIILFLGFMSLLAIAFLFMFVYNSPPVDTTGETVEEPVNQTNKSGVVHDAVQGWKGLIDDFGSGMDAFTGSSSDS